MSIRNILAAKAGVNGILKWDRIEFIEDVVKLYNDRIKADSEIYEALELARNSKRGSVSSLQMLKLKEQIADDERLRSAYMREYNALVADVNLIIIED